MISNRGTAIVVGVLYIIGTVTGILSVAVTTPILGDPNYLAKVALNENQMLTGALLVLTMGFALAMVPVMLFPILKRYNEVLALGYVVFRGALETVTYIALAIPWFFLIIVSQEYRDAGVSGASYFQTLGTLLQRGHDSINSISIIVFGLGALMLYYLFYRSNLIPRWICGWGFMAIVLNLATGFLIIFHLMSAFSTINIVVNLPIALQEMVMAVWLIVKGFNPSASVFGSARADAS